jgi:hypothetical protein
MCAYRSIRSHRNRDRPRYVYGATRSSVAEPMSRVWWKPLLDQKRDLDFRFSAQMSRSTSRGYYPPTPLICGCAVANLAPSTRGFFIGQSIDLRTLDRHRDAAVTSLIPALSCRSCRPNAPFAELVRLSRTSIADEMREEHWRRECWGTSPTDTA